MIYYYCLYLLLLLDTITNYCLFHFYPTVLASKPKKDHSDGPPENQVRRIPTIVVLILCT